jgi:outer membrane protein assembly factor BamA
LDTFRYFLFLFILWLLGVSNVLAQNLRLKVVGFNASETSILDSMSYKASFKNYKTLNEEVVLLQKRLQNIGYIECQVIKTTQINDSTYQSTFSLKQRFYTIYIYYNKETISPALIKTISTDFNNDYFVLPIHKIESVLGHLNTELSNNGFPFAKLSLQNIEKTDPKTLKADLLIDTTTKRYIDNVVVKGYENFPKSYISHFLNINKGQPFNLNEINKKTERLKNLSFTNRARSPEVLFSKDSTILYLYLEKVKSNTFDGFLGFGTNETTNKFKLDGYLNLTLENNLNYGELFNLIYKSDENQQKTFNANLTLPYLFGLPIGTEFALNIFKKDSSFTTVNQNAGIFYQVNSKHRLASGISSIQSNSLLNQQTSVSDIQDYRSTFIKTTYSYRQLKLYDILFPIDLFITTSLGVGKRNSNNQNQQQTELKFTASKILTLDNNNSFYINTAGNVLLSDSYFVNELFRFGGINSIRGFEENSLFASKYGLVNFEYRYRVNSGIYIHSITDVAYFENQLDNHKARLFGFGFGFGILTKAGLLKLNYANGKSENQNFKLSNSKIHLSLNAIF